MSGRPILMRMGAQVEAMMQKLAVVGTPMPSTMQQNMVRKRPMNMARAGMGTREVTASTPEISLEARPVTVTQPAIMPAMPQATDTVMAPLPPASRASRIFSGVRRSLWLRKPTRTAARMEKTAARCMVVVPALTSHTSSTRGASR